MHRLLFGGRYEPSIASRPPTSNGSSNTNSKSINERTRHACSGSKVMHDIHVIYRRLVTNMQDARTHCVALWETLDMRPTQIPGRPEAEDDRTAYACIHVSTCHVAFAAFPRARAACNAGSNFAFTHPHMRRMCRPNVYGANRIRERSRPN